MERESFEDTEVAQLLNNNFISIKVDKEERPDIDAIYMQVCQAMTGSGGWPLTIIMTPGQKPFYAGTYLPKHTRYRVPGLIELVNVVTEKWQDEHENLQQSADEITRQVKAHIDPPSVIRRNPVHSEVLIEKAFKMLQTSFDAKNGGFGRPPKFPTPHNLVFLLHYYRVTGDKSALSMTEKTLLQMHKGGLFDHIGFGFSRYSTDEQWLAPHFEKMLYDNAMLIMAYTYAYNNTQNEVYKQIVQQTTSYVVRELTSSDGGFYCAQDADSEGEEGKYYLFEPNEIIECLGLEDGTRFNRYFDITPNGNFEGKSIPNRLHHNTPDDSMESLRIKVYNYRQIRTKLHKDDKILASWNGLMIAALAMACKSFDEPDYLRAAERALHFAESNLITSDIISASYRDGRRSDVGFLDDYACIIFALVEMYNASLDSSYLYRAVELCKKAILLYFDTTNGGFFLSGSENESLIFKFKETYDGAIPSGNAIMFYNMVMLTLLTGNDEFNAVTDKQLNFMNERVSSYPAGHCFYLLGLLLRDSPPKHIVCVQAPGDDWNAVRSALPKDALITVITGTSADYPLIDGHTTYYVCENNQCMPGCNTL